MDASATFISHRDRVDGIDHASSVGPSARLTILDADAAPDSRIVLGREVYIGPHVELTAGGGGSIAIDDDTSIQSSSIIAGDVTIGAHCLFGRYVFVASRGHTFRERPSWLIRDQDAYSLAFPPSGNARNRPVRIEDDCWFGQSVVVSPGVYIGRGAVIGANTVVTSDIGPYEIHGGMPNRKIGQRLKFVPPCEIEATDDDALPFFYRGFKLRQADLVRSRSRGLVHARDKACLVLAAAAGRPLRLVGECLRGGEEMALSVRIAGMECARQSLPPGPFEIVVDLPEQRERAASVPAPLMKATMVDLECGSRSYEPGWGLRRASLE